MVQTQRVKGQAPSGAASSSMAHHIEPGGYIEPGGSVKQWPSGSGSCECDKVPFPAKPLFFHISCSITFFLKTDPQK
ncbi:MAG: hypothetical protein AN484_11870 [Aphanizomenon flos-aquae WA102]|uniref:Uncharacterized protein n=1 Tax=Aphanizomenon flos-aquae WA102 TaxID=1710896 RepID=A0A1B7X2I6_APHFL|nr:MAG: hypothetical protein AN484_11870 [Aphanizomenon flos-aquae WA102]